MKRLLILLPAIMTILLPVLAVAAISTKFAPVALELKQVETEPKSEMIKTTDPEDGTTIYLHKKAIIGTSQIMDAKVVSDIFDDQHVRISLKPDAAKKFHDFTKKNVGKKVATLVDGKVVQVSTIREPIESGLCEFKTATRLEAERIVRGIAPPLPSMQGLSPEKVAQAYFTALQDRGMPIIVEFMHGGEMAKFKDIFIAIMEKEAASGKRELISGLFGEQATLVEVKALSPKEFMAVFMQKASGMASIKGFTFEKLDVLGSIPEGELMHVVARIEIGLWPASMKKMDVVSMKRDGAEWKLMLTKEFDGLLQLMQNDLAK